jgi:hypothetical protein
MATPKFHKFVRPEAARPGQITDRDPDLDILDAVLRYRFCSAAQIVRLAGGNEDVTHRRLRRLWECGLVARWAFPGYLHRHKLSNLPLAPVSPGWTKTANECQRDPLAFMCRQLLEN